MMRLSFAPEAFAHVAEVFAWYQGQQDGLGWEFSDELEHVQMLLKEQPELGPVVYRDLRRILLPRFPYALFYSLTAGHIRIRALIHTRSHPRRWRPA